MTADPRLPVFVAVGDSHGGCARAPYGVRQGARIVLSVSTAPDRRRVLQCPRARTVSSLQRCIADARTRGKTLVWIPVSISDEVGHANALWVDLRAPVAAVYLFEPHGADLGHAQQGATRGYYDSTAYEALMGELVAAAWEGLDGGGGSGGGGGAAAVRFFPPSSYMPPVFGQSWHPSGSDGYCVAWAVAFLLGATAMGPREWVAAQVARAGTDAGRHVVMGVWGVMAAGGRAV